MSSKNVERDCEIHYVSYASKLLADWECERRDTKQKTKEELHRLSLRYLTRCLITLSERNRSISIMDCELDEQDFRRVVRALKDLNSESLTRTRFLETNVPSVLHNTHKLTPLMPNLRIVKLKNFIKANTLVLMPLMDGYRLHLFLSHLRLDRDDSLQVSSAVSALCEQSETEMTVQLNECVLDDTFRPHFHPMTNLSNLILRGCNFAEPLEFLSLLKNLHYLLHLDVSNCGLSETCIEVLKEVFLSNQVITHLNLSDNTLGGAKEYELLKSISCLGKLEQLHLYHCWLSRFCGRGFETLFRTGVSQSLKVLSLNFNQFQGNPEVLMAISNCRSLEEIYLYNAQIMKRNCSSLRQILQQNENLRVIDLSQNDFEGGEDILQALCVCRNLEKLGLYNTQLDDSCLFSLNKVMRNNQSLAELNLSRNPSFTSHASLFDALAQSKDLEKVYLKQVGLVRPMVPQRSLFDEPEDPENDKEWSDVIVMCNKIQDAFLKFITSCRKLRVLELGKNEMWPRILEALIKTNNLEKLFLYGCNMKYECVSALTEVVKVNSKLRILDLEGNEFTKTRQLFEALETSQIGSVDLRNANINDHKIMQIVSLIESARKKHQDAKLKKELGKDKNRGLDHIMFSENRDLSVEGLEKLLELLEAEDSGSNPAPSPSKASSSSEKPGNKKEVVQKINSKNLKPVLH
ncbi:uncharacterized protein LOC134846352 [Symsagittifera roscoffensis]|uniref:uncharacterized protein LOC134846352 n=1 Tax=Symsagittifera roscoffensis TaxID=84072 RepID=UPI00307B4D1E